MAVILGAELIPELQRVGAVLSRYEVDTQRLLVGFMTIRHALKMRSPEGAQMVLAGVHKHATQILRQHAEFASAAPGAGTPVANDDPVYADDVLDGRKELIRAFQTLHAAIVANNNPVTQQKLIELLTVRVVLADSEDDPHQDLDALHQEVQHLVRRFFAPDVMPEDEFLMTLMASV